MLSKIGFVAFVIIVFSLYVLYPISLVWGAFRFAS